MKLKSLVAALAVSAVALSAAPVHAGGTYQFTITCAESRHVERWNTGDLDPGYEYLRAMSGNHNPNCSVGDYDPQQDGNLPVEEYDGIKGILGGIPTLPGIELPEIFDFGF